MSLDNWILVIVMITGFAIGYIAGAARSTWLIFRETSRQKEDLALAPDLIRTVGHDEPIIFNSRNCNLAAWVEEDGNMGDKVDRCMVCRAYKGRRCRKTL